jgi:hypothetical protein
MKVFSALLLIAFLFSGAKPVSQAEGQTRPVTDNYEVLPDRLNQASEKMESVSHKMQKLK